MQTVYSVPQMHQNLGSLGNLLLMFRLNMAERCYVYEPSPRLQKKVDGRSGFSRANPVLVFEYTVKYVFFNYLKFFIRLLFIYFISH